MVGEGWLVYCLAGQQADAQQVSKPFGAGLALCSQEVHCGEGARWGGAVISKLGILVLVEHGVDGWEGCLHQTAVLGSWLWGLGWVGCDPGARGDSKVAQYVCECACLASC